MSSKTRLKSIADAAMIQQVMGACKDANVRADKTTIALTAGFIAGKLGLGEFSDPDQPQRHANSLRTGVYERFEKEYDASRMSGKKVLVTGSNRGIGLALCKELCDAKAEVYATCRSPSKELEALGVKKIIAGIDVTSDSAMKTLVGALGDVKLDVVVNNAGYFMVLPETVDSLNFKEQMKMIDICALGPLRVSSALFNAGCIRSPGGKIAMITSQGGSIAWRDVQNAGGPYDYGHHMSKAAANMMGKLLSIELKNKGITVYNLHPGFNRTGMTKKYSHIWDVEGAVDASLGAKRICHEISKMEISKAGRFVNCEDGLDIPW